MSDLVYEAAKAEHRAWKAVCDALVKAGAVTNADLGHPMTANATPGDKLFAALREWGDKRGELIHARVRRALQEVGL